MINRFSFLALCGVACTALAAAIVGASVSTDDWKLSGPFGGTATTVAVNPKNASTVLAGGMSSLLYQSDDAGSSWKLLDLPKRTLSEVTAILIDPVNTDHYLVGILAAEDGGGLFESFDRGSTWTPVKDVSGLGVRALAASVSDPSHLVVGTQRGVMLSTDSGKTWTRISDPANLEMTSITAVAIDPKDPGIIFAGTSHLPWRTRDGGKTWESIHDGMIDDSDVFSIYVDPHTPEKVFASACSGIYASDNRGDLWHKLMGIPNTSRRTHVVRFEPGTCCGDPSTPGAVYAGTTTGLFRSLNDGKTWSTLTGTQVNSLAFDPSQASTVYLALEHEGVGKSRNGGQTIDLVNNGFVDRVISSIAVSGKKLVAIEPQDGETSGVFTSSDAGQSWSQIRNPKGIPGVHLTAITGSSSEDRVLVAASSHQLYKSIDAGFTWKAVPVRIVMPAPPAPAPPAPAQAAPVKPVKGKTTTTARARTTRPIKPKPTVREVSPSDVYALYSAKDGTKEAIFAATDLGLLKSDDMAESWTQCELPGAGAVTGLYFSQALDGNLMARTSAGLYATKDFGEHWTSVAFPLPASDVYDVALPPDSSAPLLVATRLGLYSSSDGGGTWYANLGGIPASTVSAVLYRAPMHAYAVEYGRLYESPDGNKSWKEIPTALHATRIRRLWIPELNADHLYGITGDLGIIFRN